MCPLLFGCWKQSLPSSKKAGFSQLLRCIIDLCQDIPSSRLPPWLTPPAATRDEEFHAACLFCGAIFHRLIISLVGCNFISVTPERTFDERRFVDAKTVMMAFITAGAAAVNTSRIFFSADWKMSHPPSFHSDLGKSRSVRAGVWAFFNLHPLLKGVNKSVEGKWFQDKHAIRLSHRRMVKPLSSACLYFAWFDKRITETATMSVVATELFFFSKM